MSRGVIKSTGLYGNGAGSNLGFINEKLGADFELIQRLDAELAFLRGQDFAVQQVKEYLFGINNRRNLKGVGGLMTFVGPPAVGKTAMAEAIARAFGRPFLRLDMSTFNDKESYCDAFGLNPSYKAAEAGMLTSFVQKHPVCVLLLDEFEKAHPNVRNRFLQVFERGEVQDLYTKQSVSFRDVIVILTTNVGRAIYDSGTAGYRLSKTPQASILNALRTERDRLTGDRVFSGALVSRMASGRVILFNKLRPEVLHAIAANAVREHIAFYESLYLIRLEADAEALAELILFNQGEAADVRTILKAVREFFERNLERMAKTRKSLGEGFFDTVVCRMDLSNATEDARRVFSPDAVSVLVCCPRSHRKYFRTTAASKIRVVYAEDDFDMKSVRSLEYAAAILDVRTERTRFSGKLFDTVCLHELPVYVYDQRATSDADFYSYTDNGANGFYYPARADFATWVGEIYRGLVLGSAATALFRTNKVVGFQTTYSFRGARAFLTVSGIDVKTAPAADDSDFLMSDRSIPRDRLSDVIGADALKESLMECVGALKGYKDYLREGIRIPRGLLMVGPPGTGKTMMARALANEAGLPFIQRNATEFLRSHVGEGAAALRELFSTARKYAPCVLFLDEIDAIAKARETEGSRYTSDVLNALLSELDGFEETSVSPVFLVAATNFDAKKGGGSSALDAAFLRRFDRIIRVPLPDIAARETYLERLLAKRNHTVSPRTVHAIAARSVGWSLAELGLVVEGAVRTCVERKRVLSDELLIEAFESFSDGEIKHYDEQHIRKTAFHEAGHAFVAYMLGIIPTHTTITARGGYGGYVYYADEKMTEYRAKDLLDRICIACAGRAAEVEFYGEDGVTTGASGDLRSATAMAEQMVCDYGMDGSLMVVGEGKRELPWVTESVKRILNEQYGRACTLIREGRARLETLANALIDKNSLDGEALKNILEGENG